MHECDFNAKLRHIYSVCSNNTQSCKLLIFEINVDFLAHWQGQTATAGVFLSSSSFFLLPSWARFWWTPNITHHFQWRKLETRKGDCWLLMTVSCLLFFCCLMTIDKSLMRSLRLFVDSLKIGSQLPIPRRLNWWQKWRINENEKFPLLRTHKTKIYFSVFFFYYYYDYDRPFRARDSESFLFFHSTYYSIQIFPLASRAYACTHMRFKFVSRLLSLNWVRSHCWCSLSSFIIAEAVEQNVESIKN